MSYGKIDPLLRQQQQHTDNAVEYEAYRANTAIKDATTPDANARLTEGVRAANATYTTSMTPLSDDTPVTLDGLAARVDRLEQTIIAMCEGQMLLPKDNADG